MVRAMSDPSAESKTPTEGESPESKQDVKPENTGPDAPAAGKAPEAPADPLAQARADADAFRDKFLRTAADFDNYRKRARRDTEEAERRSRETLLRELLPVFDNLERAVTHAAHATDAKAVVDGVRMVLRQFLDTLDRVGIRRVPTVGAAFDPNLHEAIQQLETVEQAPGTIVAEVQAGYQMGERLIRAAMVVVAKAPQGG
jgi:molecular chaperone GrpE